MAEIHETGDEISLLALGTILLRNRWRVLRWTGIGAAIAALIVFSKPVLFRASASFAPQGNDVSRSGLASLAGQLGMQLQTSNQSLSPDFYAKLIKSHVLLLPIARDTFAVQEMGGKRSSLLDLLEIPKLEGPEAQREEKGIKQLARMISVSTDKTTGVVAFSIATKWRSVSLGIATAVINGVNDYNQRSRQDQASAERKFIEGRLAVAASDLRAAEERLESFLLTNRDMGSPQTVMQRDRLQRDVILRQQVYTSLMQSYEDARIREVRDTPVITMFETPWVPVDAESRGRLKGLALGIVLGGFVGAVLAFMSDRTASRRKAGDVEAEEFAGTLSEVKGEMLGPVRRLRARMGR